MRELLKGDRLLLHMDWWKLLWWFCVPLTPAPAAYLPWCWFIFAIFVMSIDVWISGFCLFALFLWLLAIPVSDLDILCFYMLLFYYWKCCCCMGKIISDCDCMVDATTKSWPQAKLSKFHGPPRTWEKLAIWTESAESRVLGFSWKRDPIW